MPTSDRSTTDRSTVYCLHYLGGSAREWRQVAELVKTARCVALDMPGFGTAAHLKGYSVAAMVASVAHAIRAEAPQRWLLAGHSMGAKVAAVLARGIEDGTLELPGFAGLLLLAGSPPSPEPMDDRQRQAMMGWFAGSLEANRADAQRYVAQNSNDDLEPATTELAVNDALRAERSAWLAWLERGSREDWSDRVGVLQTPALIVAGENDEQLGPSAQRTLMAPHFAHCRLATLAEAKHLLPLERPVEIARLIDEVMAEVDFVHRCVDTRTAAYRALIASERVGAKTREVLLARDQSEDPAYEPVAMNAATFAALRAVLGRVVPQAGTPHIDLAARIDQDLGSGAGDGWRFAALPPDAQAYRAGLSTLDEAARREHGREFAGLDDALQDDLLQRVAAGHLEVVGGEAAYANRLSAHQLRAWFEDLRSDAVKAYMGHPQTLARIGYSGIANGGDGAPKTGFARIGLGEREAWEPVAASVFER